MPDADEIGAALAGATVMVTGAGGFIGLRFVERARALGLRVQALERSAEGAEHARQAGAEVVVQGDVCDPAAVARAAQGAQYVLHAAALMSERGCLEEFRRVNVEGARTTAAVSAACGVRKFVHLSSVLIYGFRFSPQADEHAPQVGCGHPYGTTKIESEPAVLESDGRHGMRVIILRPALVYGPGSPDFVIRPVQMMRRGLFTLVRPRGIMNHLYVDNLIDAVFLAFEKEPADQVFNISDGAQTPRSVYFRRLARLVRRPLIPLSYRVVRVLLRAQGWLARRFGRNPIAEPIVLDLISTYNDYSIARARAQLGYAPRVTFEEGMQRVEAWLRSSGYVN